MHTRKLGEKLVIYPRFVALFCGNSICHSFAPTVCLCSTNVTRTKQKEFKQNVGAKEWQVLFPQKSERVFVAFLLGHYFRIWFFAICSCLIVGVRFSFISISFLSRSFMLLFRIQIEILCLSCQKSIEFKLLKWKFRHIWKFWFFFLQKSKLDTQCNQNTI